jgi:hypothetical protein
MTTAMISPSRVELLGLEGEEAREPREDPCCSTAGSRPTGGAHCALLSSQPVWWRVWAALPEAYMTEVESLDEMALIPLLAAVSNAP